MPVAPGSKTIGCKRRLAFPIAPQVAGVTRQVLEAMVMWKVSPTHLGRLSGVSRETIYRWAKGRAPRLHDLEAVIQVLGLQLVLLQPPKEKRQ